MKKASNLEPLIKFLESALEDLEALKIDLTQALGRAKNLKIEEEDRGKEA